MDIASVIGLERASAAQGEASTRAKGLLDGAAREKGVGFEAVYEKAESGEEPGVRAGGEGEARERREDAPGRERNPASDSPARELKEANRSERAVEALEDASASEAETDPEAADIDVADLEFDPAQAPAPVAASTATNAPASASVPEAEKAAQGAFIDAPKDGARSADAPRRPFEPGEAPQAAAHRAEPAKPAAPAAPAEQAGVRAAANASPVAAQVGATNGAEEADTQITKEGEALSLAERPEGAPNNAPRAEASAAPQSRVAAETTAAQGQNQGRAAGVLETTPAGGAQPGDRAAAAQAESAARPAPQASASETSSPETSLPETAGPELPEQAAKAAEEAVAKAVERREARAAERVGPGAADVAGAASERVGSNSAAGGQTGDSGQDARQNGLAPQGAAQGALNALAGAAEGAGFDANFGEIASTQQGSGAGSTGALRAEYAAATAQSAAGARGASVAGQIGAAVLSRGDDRRIVVQLDPVELGRVSIELTFADDALSVSVRAERQDALDLMRRHAGDLERQLREAGLDFDSLSFGAEGGREGGFGQDRANDAARDGFVFRGGARLDAPSDAALQSPAATRARASWTDGVDLRV